MEIVRADALYKQLANVIRDEIAKGVYGTGELLPSEAAMSERYNVSRPTVRQALIALRTEGLIQVRMGKGSFVRRSYDAAAVTVDRTRPAELVPDAEPTRYRADADARISELLNIEAGHPLFVEDTTSAEDETGRRVLTRRSLPFSTAEGTNLQTEPFPDHDALIRILTAAAGKLAAVEYVRSRMPSPDEAASLELSDITPILETTRVYSAKTRPLFATTERTSAEGIQLSYRV
jgi:GntR family transcriptional regulator